MPDPSVACIMLTRDRPEMAERAVRSFERQTYGRRRLLIYDTATPPVTYPEYGGGVLYYSFPPSAGKSIGALRNEAIEFAMIGAQPDELDIIATWDSDDLSHPNRLAEQVAMLQSGDYDAVGYNQMLFWKVGCGPSGVDPMERTMPVHPGESYLYTHPHSNFLIGTSMCYWRRTWEEKPFPDLPQSGNPDSASEDFVWQSGLRCESVTSLRAWPVTDEVEAAANIRGWTYACEPRMIATIHGGNYSMPNYDKGIRLNDEFKRAPEWDEAVRAIVEAA